MTVAAVYSLAMIYPTVQIDVATTPFCARLFLNPPANVTVHGYDLKTEYSGTIGMWRLLRALSSLHPDCVADLHNVARSWVIDAWFRLRGVRVAMVDKMRAGRTRVLHHKEEQPNFIDRYADVFARLGYPITHRFSTLFSDGAPVTPVEVNHPAVGVAPFARYFNKTYPQESMKRTVDILTERGINVYLFGARGREAEQLARWTTGNPRCHNLAGRFDLEQELALMASMDVMVSMDSANQHMASLTGTPVVSLWGSTTPACGFMGYGQKRANALCVGLDCQPCSIAGKPECPLGTLECFAALPPVRVADKVIGVLSEEGKV